MIPFLVTALLPDRSTRPVQSVPSSSNSKAAFVCICNEPTLHFHKYRSEISICRRTLFVFPCATDLLGNNFAAVVHSNTESIILQVSAPWQRRSTLSKNPPLSLDSCLPGQDIIQHIITLSHFSVRSTNPSVITFSARKWLDMRFHPESQWSSPPLSSWGASAQRGSQISIYVRHFVERFRWAVLGFCETWAAANNYLDS